MAVCYIIPSEVMPMIVLTNITIDAPSFVVRIGKIGTDARIINSSVISKEIVFSTQNIAIESYSPASCLLASMNNITGETPQIDINLLRFSPNSV